MANILTLKQGENPAKAGIESIGWISGHWREGSKSDINEEVWSPPMAKTMMGMFRSVVAGRVKFYELMTIGEVKGSLLLRIKHFNPELIGWEERENSVEFPLVKISDSEAYFDGLTFRLTDPDSLTVIVRIGLKQLKDSELAFNYQRYEV